MMKCTKRGTRVKTATKTPAAAVLALAAAIMAGGMVFPGWSGDILEVRAETKTAETSGITLQDAGLIRESEAAPYVKGTGLAPRGNTSGISEKVSLIDEMTDRTDAGGIYGDYVDADARQIVDFSGRVLMSSIRTGNRFMDPVMKRVGYSDYTIWYYYDNPDVSGERLSDGPVYAHCLIDGRYYNYYYCGSQLIRRLSAGAATDNLEVNDFLDQVWQIGRYYRNILMDGTEEAIEAAGGLGHDPETDWAAPAAEGETRRITFINTRNGSAVQEENGRLILKVGAWENDSAGTGKFRLIVDENTVFDKADSEGYAGRQDGDKPIDWYRRCLEVVDRGEDPPDAPGMITAMSGVFDVEVTGSHIDRFYGAYWWD